MISDEVEAKDMDGLTCSASFKKEAWSLDNDDCNALSLTTLNLLQRDYLCTMRGEGLVGIELEKLLKGADNYNRECDLNIHS